MRAPWKMLGGRLDGGLKEWAPFVPFLGYFVLLCIPGFANIASVNLSVLLFPLIVIGYATASKRFFADVLPDMQKLILLLLFLVVTYLMWSFVTAIGAPSFVRVFRPIYAHVSGIGLVIAMFALSNTRKNASRVRFVTITLLVLTLATTYLVGPRSYGDRFPGMFKHPNQLGVVASMVTVYLLCGVLARTTRFSSWRILALVAAFAALILCGSKTNLVAVAAIAIVAVPLTARLDRDPRAALLSIYRNLAILVLTILVTVPALSYINGRAFGVLNEVASGDTDVDQYRTIVARNDLWKESWQNALDSPVTGIGSGQLMSDGTEHSHNIFMDAVRTTGFPGLIIITVIIFVLVYLVICGFALAPQLARLRTIPLSDSENAGPFTGSLLALISYLASNQMSDSFGPSTLPFFYMFLGYVVMFFRAYPTTPMSMAGPAYARQFTEFPSGASGSRG